MDESLNKIKDILKKEIGLDANTLGDATIDKILHQRMHACQIDNIEDYYHFIIQNSDELAVLLETAVIPETWFFRDTRPFKLVADHIKQYSKQKKICNILCIPCSTGEEPYSICMYLLQAGIAADVFNIHAVDISNNALSLAKQGVYGNNSFRNDIAKTYQKTYFEHDGGKEILKKNVKDAVNFSRMNILNESELSSLNVKFDFIFCRNLLIYFDINTKEKAFKNLHTIMQDNGMVFIGHSEFGSVPKNLFTVCGNDQAFGLIKYKPTEKPNKKPIKPQQNLNNKIYKSDFNTVKKDTASPFNKLKLEKSKSKKIAENKNNQTNTEGDLLTIAKTLADQENLSAAESTCFEFIDKHGDTAESFFILGLINEASKHYDIAEDFFRKSIYLDPKHYNSLLHLALLLRKLGDTKSAELFMKRAERINDTKTL